MGHSPRTASYTHPAQHVVKNSGKASTEGAIESKLLHLLPRKTGWKIKIKTL